MYIPRNVSRKSPQIWSPFLPAANSMAQYTPLIFNEVWYIIFHTPHFRLSYLITLKVDLRHFCFEFLCSQRIAYPNDLFLTSCPTRPSFESSWSSLQSQDHFKIFALLTFGNLFPFCLSTWIVSDFCQTFRERTGGNSPVFLDPDPDWIRSQTDQKLSRKKEKWTNFTFKRLSVGL